ncbi:hypothetical protein [Okeania sp. SIO2B9]|uniref:hypothetical protein n=1 Tax=Okeania sp. SIO2B9 TaxID=2607782 RepID=UPI00142A2F16|nr:hypothetical protein [Okeania sp. SIO2B9]NES91554.1 hypothetical protein [Okeania sp. SIO2B9]
MQPYKSIPWNGTYPVIKEKKVYKSLAVYNDENWFVGSPLMALKFYKLGIMPTVIKGRTICSIGYSEQQNIWYGWTPERMRGFKIGDEVKLGDAINESVWTDDYLAKNPHKDLSLPIGFKAETIEDCKRMAIAFANSA